LAFGAVKPALVPETVGDVKYAVVHVQVHTLWAFYALTKLKLYAALLIGLKYNDRYKDK
jgi:hypothetical protein